MNKLKLSIVAGAMTAIVASCGAEEVTEASTDVTEISAEEAEKVMMEEIVDEEIENNLNELEEEAEALEALIETL